MKTTKLLVLALILNSQALFSQANVSIGIIGGPMADVSKDAPDYFPEKWMPSFSVGTAIRIDLKKHIFLQTEVSYERKGYSLGPFEWTDFNANPIGTSTPYERFNYVLLTPTVGFSTNGKVHIEGSLGVFSGYLTNVKTVFVKSSLAIPDRPINSDLKAFNRFDLGCTSRLGVGFNLGKKLSAKVNAIGNLGLTKPFKPRIGAPSNFSNDKTVSLGMQLGVFYKI
jgi:hypothetical protein